MAHLTDELKHEIVSRISRFQSYAHVATEMSADHTIQIDRVQVRAYDPTTSKYCAGERWRTIFQAARDKFLHDISSIPIASQAYRLNMLQELADGAREAGDAKGLREALKLAAKEVGGALTNQRTVTIDGRRRAREMTADERRETLFNMMDERLAQMATDQGSATVQ